MTCALYRHFDKDGALLYVGISLSPIHRLEQHRSVSGWFSEIARVEIETFATRLLAEKAERDSIAKERPKHNVAHVVKSSPLRDLAIRVRGETDDQNIIEMCDYLLASTADCPVCAARRFAKTASQRKWRARHREVEHGQGQG